MKIDSLFSGGYISKKGNFLQNFLKSMIALEANFSLQVYILNRVSLFGVYTTHLVISGKRKLDYDNNASQRALKLFQRFDFQELYHDGGLQNLENWTLYNLSIQLSYAFEKS